MGNDDLKSDTQRGRHGLGVRTAGELLVIIVAVVIGLAVDRWMADIDEGVQAERLTARLLVDLRSDSTELEGWLELFQTTESDLLGILEVIADPQATVEDPTTFVQTLEFAGWWAPFDPSLSTWGEINSIGQLDLFEPEVRSALTGYYEGVSFFGTIEDRWAPSFADYWMRLQGVLPPMLRIAAIDQRAGGDRAREVTPEEAASVVAAFRGDPVLQGALGQVTTIYRYGAIEVERLSTDANATLKVMAGR